MGDLGHIRGLCNQVAMYELFHHTNDILRYDLMEHPLLYWKKIFYGRDRRLFLVEIFLDTKFVALGFPKLEQNDPELPMKIVEPRYLFLFQFLKRKIFGMVH
jgi:hypothetical protein